MRSTRLVSTFLAPSACAVILLACADGSTGGPSGDDDTAAADDDAADDDTVADDDDTVASDDDTGDDDDSGDDDDTSTDEPTIISISPMDGLDEVEISRSISALVLLDDGEDVVCGFNRDNTVFSVSGPDGPIPGALFFYNTVSRPMAERVDFYPDGFLLSETLYQVTVQIPCTGTARSSFTTAALGGESPLVEGSSINIEIGKIVHPPVIGPFLEAYLAESPFIAQFTEVDITAGVGSSKLVVGFAKPGGDGENVTFDPYYDSLAAVLEGEISWPFIKVSGTMTLPLSGGVEAEVEYFEFGGSFAVDDSGVFIPRGYIVAVLPCNDLCRALDAAAPELGLDCIEMADVACNEDDQLNLLGTYTAAANDLSEVQTVTVWPALGSTVSSDVRITAQLDAPLDPAREYGMLEFWLQTGDYLDPTEISGVVAPADDLMSATFTPFSPLAPGRYTAVVIVDAAGTTTFTVE